MTIGYVCGMIAINHTWKAPRSTTPNNCRPRLETRQPEFLIVGCGACCGTGRLLEDTFVICPACGGRSWTQIPAPTYDAGL